MTTHKEDAMRRTHQALITLTLGLALVTATTAAWATPPTGTQDQADQRRSLYQPQPDRSLQQRAQAGSEQERTLARHRALGTIAAQPAPRTDPAAPSPDVNLLATLLVGLVGGLVGGAAAMLGWTATTCRRRPPAPSAAEPPSPTGRPWKKSAPEFWAGSSGRIREGT
jgi:hypothetical protein